MWCGVNVYSISWSNKGGNNTSIEFSVTLDNQCDGYKIQNEHEENYLNQGENTSSSLVKMIFMIKINSNGRKSLEK